ncbi:MAG: hypothetical protein IPP69_17515 [Flavobacteriales bacterium]|nr:hypothetical protein [Flavobacteriales bacterium]
MLQQEKLRKSGVTDADGLFEFFLIDVQMDTCMETSRIKQAISSVQLFIQRCLIGLEDGIHPSVLDRNRWEWMQRYRVWEANRKVLLYPENWIESNLRDDKSPFFKELESELLQKDITKENVTDALKNYLYKVDEVANMEVVGLYIETDSEIIAARYMAEELGGELVSPEKEIYRPKKLHVFSRTRNSPSSFFYRYLKMDEMHWYPWEKIQVDIPCYSDQDATGTIIDSGCYLIPYVWNGKLLIFFPQITKKTIKDPDAKSNSTNTANEGAQANTMHIEFYEIKMAWSEYRNGKWTQKKISEHAVIDNGTTITDKATVASNILIAYENAIGDVQIALGKFNLADSNLNQAKFELAQVGELDDIPTFLNKLASQAFYEPDDFKKPLLYAEFALAVLHPVGSYGVYVAAHKLKKDEATKNVDDKQKLRDEALNNLEGKEKDVQIPKAEYEKASQQKVITHSLCPISSFRFIPASSINSTKETLPGIRVFRDKVEIGSFEFDGSNLTTDSKTYLWKGPTDPTNFHYQYPANKPRKIESFQLQVKPGQFVFEEFGKSNFSNTNKIQKNYHPHIHQLFGLVNENTLSNFFNFYKANKISIDLSDAFGTFTDESQTGVQKSYHELKRPYSLYNWELFFHAPMMIADALGKHNILKKP